MEQPKIRPKKFLYKSAIKWQGEKKGTLSCADKPPIDVTPPPEFKGPPGFWTPEDLLLASVNSCLMMTFLAYAARESIELIGYESETEGVLEMVGEHLAFSKVQIMVRISVKSPAEIEKTKSVLRIAKEHCIISNSIKAVMDIVPEIKSVTA